MNQNEYRPHPIYIDYEACRDGNVRHRQRRKPIGNVNNMGYLCISINFQGQMKKYRAHRFVVEVFIGEIPPGYVVDHIDGNKLNNRINNLQIVTQQQNCLKKNHNRNPRIPRPVIAFYGNEITDFPSISSAAKFFNIEKASVVRVADYLISSSYSDRFDCRVSFCWA